MDTSWVAEMAVAVASFAVAEDTIVETVHRDAVPIVVVHRVVMVHYKDIAIVVAMAADTAVLDSTVVVGKVVVMPVNKVALDSIVVNMVVMVAQIADSCSSEFTFFTSN